MIVQIDVKKVTKAFEETLPDRLTLVGAFVQGEVVKNIEQNFKSQGHLSGAVSFKVNKAKKLVRISANMEYAAIHEFGGDIHPTVTKKMRAWAWAMFHKTKNEMYRGIALTKKDKLDIHIPARPYLTPALYNNQDKIVEVFNVQRS